MFRKFNSLSLSPDLLQVISELGFTTLTPIQAQSIPLLLEGRDLVGQSKTGSGKTAAFALPILQKINLQVKEPQALILCPTRELCTQVAREIRKFGRRFPGLQVLMLSGGQPVRDQTKILEKGVHIAVGTPGRLVDHLTRKTLDLRHISTLVLDEADRMLEMGFEKEMEQILKATPKDRQTLFFSATYPASIESMSRNYQRNPVRVTIEEKEETHDIQQIFYAVSPEEKPQALLTLLQKHMPESSLAFCNLKSTVTEATQFLLESGVSAGCLHGDLEQSERDRVMAKFRNHSIRVLVATDVAARGIDVENLDIVFNVDLAVTPDVHVHRIGRTGRAGKKGLAISFVTDREGLRFEAVQTYTDDKFPLETLDLKISKKALPLEAKMETLFISGGRKEKIRAGDILGALTGDAGGFKGSDIGKIEIHDRFSYVALSTEIAQKALQTLKNGKIKGKKLRVEMVKK